ncbi:hypothetical protein BJQ89_03467 [Arthrobacter sp. ES1]|nr:hypothetical protein [Arthrobacter sp. ES1]
MLGEIGGGAVTDLAQGGKAQGIFAQGEDRLRQPIAVDVDPVLPAGPGEDRDLAKGLEGMPAAFVPVVFAEAGVAAVQDGHVEVAVAVEVRQQRPGGAVRGGFGEPFLRAEDTAAQVWFVVPGAVRHGEDTGQALAADVRESVVGAV